MNIGETPRSRQSHIKLGTDGELEEPLPVPELGTYRRSRLRRIVDALSARRESPPRPDAETLNRYLSLGLTTHPTVCKHCGTHWREGSKSYCVVCGYPLPVKRPFWDEADYIFWMSIYIVSTAGVFIVPVVVVFGGLGGNTFGLIFVVCLMLSVVSQIAGGFGRYGDSNHH